MKWTKKRKVRLAVRAIIGVVLLGACFIDVYIFCMTHSWSFANLDQKLDALEREFLFELPPEWTCDSFCVDLRQGRFSSTIWISGEVVQADFLETQFGLNSSNKVSTQYIYISSLLKYGSYERDGIRFAVYEEKGNRVEIVISKSGLSNCLLLLGPKKTTSSIFHWFPHPG